MCQRMLLAIFEIENRDRWTTIYVNTEKENSKEPCLPLLLIQVAEPGARTKTVSPKDSPRVTTKRLYMVSFIRYIVSTNKLRVIYRAPAFTPMHHGPTHASIPIHPDPAPASIPKHPVPALPPAWTSRSLAKHKPVIS